jgi:hypothetical protein
MPDTMIERMTAAIEEWNTEALVRDPKLIARAVLTAMREATDPMREAAYLAAADGDVELCSDAWPVMIDAALAEEG